MKKVRDKNILLTTQEREAIREEGTLQSNHRP